MNPYRMSIADNLERVRGEIHSAAQRAGRSPDEITLVAVSKTMPAEVVLEAVAAGARVFGENRVQEAADKIPVIRARVRDLTLRWDMVGHLQRRQARDAVALFDVIQSVDTLRLAETMARHAATLGIQIPVLLQVNVGNDENKSGWSPEPRSELEHDIEQILALEEIKVQGLMTITPLTATAEAARPYFKALRVLRDELAARFPHGTWRELSMGMINDFGVAIEEGATLVRVGRAIFGERR